MPNIGEIKQGREIGKKSLSQRFIFATCVGCGKPRWVHYYKKRNEAKSDYCKVCGHLGTNKGSRVPLAIRRINSLFTCYGVRSRRKNLTFNLTKIYFAKLVDSDCYYCGSKPSNKGTFGRGLVLIYQGIDRVDNSKGYEIDNVVPCCIVCNKMKKAMGQDEFLLHIHKISAQFTVDTPQADFQYEVYEMRVL